MIELLCCDMCDMYSLFSHKNSPYLTVIFCLLYTLYGEMLEIEDPKHTQKVAHTNNEYGLRDGECWIGTALNMTLEQGEIYWKCKSLYA